MNGQQKISIRFFNDREVRAIWDEQNAKWWFSVVDVVGILNQETDFTKAGNYWRWLKRKLPKEKIQFVSGTHKKGYNKFTLICLAAYMILPGKSGKKTFRKAVSNLQYHNLYERNG